MVFPMSYIFVAAMLFDIPLTACARILLSPFYYVVSLLAVAAGYGLWEMRRWSWYLLLLSQALVVYENAIFVSSHAESHHKIFGFFLFLFIQILLIYRIAKEIRVPYFFPKIRWWESNPRYRLSTPVQVFRGDGTAIEGEVLDVSLAGCFIKTRFDFAPDETVRLKFRLYGHVIEGEGKSVWAAQSSVTHPKGIGVKFGAHSKSQKRALRSIGRRLRKIAKLYRNSRYLISPEDFVKQLETAESSEVKVQGDESTV
jgi:hypothetical protein